MPVSTKEKYTATPKRNDVRNNSKTNYTTPHTGSATVNHGNAQRDILGGHPKTYDVINTRDIAIHPDYQRSMDDRKSNLNKVIKEFNPDEAKIIQLALIDGVYYCFNGQLTLEATKRVAGRDLDIVCEVIHGLTMQEMAKLFVKQDDNNTRVSKSDTIRVDANAGDPDAMLFKSITERYGFSTDKTPYRAKGLIYIQAPTAAWKEFQNSTTEQFETILTVMRFLDGDEYQCHNGIISGIGWFVREFDGQFKVEDLGKSLKRSGGLEVVQTARKLNSVEPRFGASYGPAVLAVYNKGRSKHRIEWR